MVVSCIKNAPKKIFLKKSKIPESNPFPGTLNFFPAFLSLFGVSFSRPVSCFFLFSFSSPVLSDLDLALSAARVPFRILLISITFSLIMRIVSCSVFSPEPDEVDSCIGAGIGARALEGISVVLGRIANPPDFTSSCFSPFAPFTASGFTLVFLPLIKFVAAPLAAPFTRPPPIDFNPAPSSAGNAMLCYRQSKDFNFIW